MRGLLDLQIKAINSAKTCVPMSLQEEARPDQIARLRKDGSQYRLDYNKDGKTKTLSAEGAYIFAIKASAPNEILIGRTHIPHARQALEADLQIAGHTSITKGEDVLFAGEILFCNGVLDWWTNRSGHYRPMTSTVTDSLLPHVQRLLPQGGYKEVMLENGTELIDHMIDTANGYLLASDEPDLRPVEPPPPPPEPEPGPEPEPPQHPLQGLFEFLEGAAQNGPAPAG
ncbi:hypothetical protein [Martelella alba]|uniref:hypothetical protein n=1 Tax=Martelella alba TaxID=2590451 RepID=UPI001AEEA99E|nr:hypothetical protein [Martelella alba]